MITANLGFMGGSVTKAVRVTPSVVSGWSGDKGTVRTDYVTTIPENMIPPLSYSWSRVSGTGGTAETPTSSSTRFFQYFLSYGNFVSEWKCTVTDAQGSVVDSDLVEVYLEGGI